jgi:hypothetical protein
MSLAANMLDMDRNNVFDVVVKSHRTNYDNCRIVDMAFWFGITSLIRPISMERIPTIRILASTKQRCAATSHHQLQTPESLQTFHRHQPSDGFAASSGAKAASAEYDLVPGDQYLFLECSDNSANASVSRAIERENGVGALIVSQVRTINGCQHQYMSLVTNGNGAET